MAPGSRVATLRQEVREGRSFSPDECAIALEQGAETVPPDYGDPAQFFARTGFARANRLFRHSAAAPVRSTRAVHDGVLVAATAPAVTIRLYPFHTVEKPRGIKPNRAGNAERLADSLPRQSRLTHARADAWAVTGGAYGRMPHTAARL